MARLKTAGAFAGALVLVVAGLAPYAAKFALAGSGYVAAIACGGVFIQVSGPVVTTVTHSLDLCA